MKAPEVLSLATRLAGLWILLSSLPGLPRALFKLWAVLLAGKAVETVEAMISIVWVYAIAYWFLTGAAWLQKLAFPDAPGAATASGIRRPE